MSETDWKSEWYELRNQMECKEAIHREEIDALKRRIAELEEGHKGSCFFCHHAKKVTESD